MGMKSDGILKGTSATCTKYRKLCFKMNETLDFNLSEQVLATELEKHSTNFPRLHS